MHKFYYQVIFTRYIVGRPNRITLPIEIKYRVGKNSSFLKDRSAKFNIRFVKLICYNDLYPRMIEIDIDHLAKIQKFRLGDLQNILPAGIELDPEYPNLDEPVVYFPVVKVDDRKDPYYWLDEPDIGQYLRKSGKTKTEGMSFEEKVAGMSDIEKGEMEGFVPEKMLMPDKKIDKNRPWKRKKIYSIKKTVKDLNLQVREEFRINQGNDQGKKK